ncbi:hypothetical protein ABNQ38_04205 [Azospirillum sp. A29]|jgi:hypothetical protein|uniref:hypothetical protein n=1 Tax=Azospirillum sp. A29 TaxID=3160606 RepID=UPI0036702994
MFQLLQFGVGPRAGSEENLVPPFQPSNDWMDLPGENKGDPSIARGTGKFGMGNGQRRKKEFKQEAIRLIATSCRTLPTQNVEARVGCKVLNVMTGLGMPVSRRVA